MGNICRSPLLEGVARQAIAAAGRSDDFELDSAGTGAWHAGQAPDRRAIAAARRQGIDIGGQRARAVQVADFARFDLILAADRENLRWLRTQRPLDARCRIELALDWACGIAEADVPDPYYGSDADFDAVYRLAEGVAQGLLRQSPPRS
jgi:protein-tyrosine phosphatase